MAISIPKISLYQFLLAICFAVPYINNYELTFAIWTLTALFTIQMRYSLDLLRQALFYFLIIVVAAFSMTFEKENLFYIIRDITYLAKPVIGFFVGYHLCRFNYPNAFRTIVYIGLAISVIHLIVILVTLMRFHSVSVNLIREYSGYFSDFEVYALIFVIFHKAFGINFSRRQFYAIAITIGLSAFLYLARTNFIQFILLLMGMKGYFIMNRRAIVAISTTVVLTVLAYTAIVYSNPRRNGDGFEAFLYKIKVAPTEPFKMKIKQDDYKDFNDNYRSVELKKTLKQVSESGTETIIFGKGLGSTVDLGRKVFLGDMKLRHISVLHNAFMTGYLKAGIIGIILLVFSMIQLYRQPRSEIPGVWQVNLLLMATGIFMLVSNWVLMGFYFTEDSKSILIGFLLSYREITIKRHVRAVAPESHS